MAPDLALVTISRNHVRPLLIWAGVQYLAMHNISLSVQDAQRLF